MLFFTQKQSKLALTQLTFHSQNSKDLLFDFKSKLTFWFQKQTHFFISKANPLFDFNIKTSHLEFKRLLDFERDSASWFSKFVWGKKLFFSKEDLLFDFRGRANKLMRPEVKVGVPQQLDEGDQKTPRVRTVDDQTLQEHPEKARSHKKWNSHSEEKITSLQSSDSYRTICSCTIFELASMNK